MCLRMEVATTSFVVETSCTHLTRTCSPIQSHTLHDSGGSHMQEATIGCGFPTFGIPRS